MTIKNAPPAPIIVSDQTVTPPLWSLLRYVFAGVGGVFVQKGYITDDTLQTLLGVAAILVPAIWGAWLSIRNKSKLIAAARSAHNDVAQVKS